MGGGGEEHNWKCKYNNTETRMDVECSRVGVMFNSLEVTLLAIVHICRCYKIVLLLLLLLRLLLESVMSLKN